MLQEQIKLSNGETIAYLKEGSGSHILVLIHGNMNSSINWDIFLEHVSETFTVYAPDLRGFGDSSYEQAITSIKDFSDDLKLFTDALKLKSFTLVGWSLGGNVSMQYAIDYPEDVKKLVLMASGSIKGFPIRKRVFFGFIKTKHYIEHLADMEKAIKPLEKLKEHNNVSFIRRLLNNSLYSKTKPDEARYAAYIEAMIKQRNLAETNLALTYFNISDTHNGVVEGNNLVSSITCPVLMIHGKEDRVVPYDVAVDNHDALKNISVLEPLDASHAPLLDSRKKVMALIESFAKSSRD